MRTSRQPGQARDSHAHRRLGDFGAGPDVAPLVDGDLMAQGKDLELEGGPRTETSANGSEDGKEDLLHGCSKLPGLGATTSVTTAVPWLSDEPS